jgi:hypothetical protein
MTVIREYTKPVRLSALHDEILAVHPELADDAMTVEGSPVLDPETGEPTGDDWVCLTLADDDTPEATLADLDAVVAAHDKATADAEAAVPETNEAQMRTAVRNAFVEMATLEAKMSDGTATTADLRRLLFLCSRNLRRLAKLVFGETNQAV